MPLTVYNERSIMAPEVRMKASTKVCTVVAVLLFVAAGFVWWRAQPKRRFLQLCLTPALEMPIRFEEGFSFTSSFTVALATNYEVEVACRRIYPNAGLFDFGIVGKHHLPIKFSVVCNGITVAQGDSPGYIGGYASQYEHTWKLADFKAQPGKSYKLSFRVVGTLPSLAATKPVVRVSVPYYIYKGLTPAPFDLFTLACSIAVLGLLFAFPACIFLVRRLIGRESPKA